MSDTSFINKYRPQTFDQVYGHTHAMFSLTMALETDNRPHTYLLTGPSGIGKTTIARLIGNYLGAEIVEIDAASHSGVDDMRELVELSQYMSLQGDGIRMYIIDECHTLSKNAWQSLLKLTEEPPIHVYIALCTTEPGKVPATIRDQRAFPVQLQPLPFVTMDEFINAICDAEQWQITQDVYSTVLNNSNGSPRKALTLLLALHAATNREEISRIFSTIDEESEALVQLCQLLLRGKPSWVAVRPLIAKIEDGQFEGALIMASRYFIGCLLRSNDERQAILMNEYIQALTFPSESFDAKTRFYAAIGKCIWR